MLKLFKKIEHERIISAINKESKFSSKFFILLVLSTVLATLGLIADNLSVVIGAMIIAPLMWPILGVSLSVTRKNPRRFHQTTLLLFVSIILTIIVAAGVSLLSPILEINGAILDRTNPNIIDLVIAIATGAVATYIVLTPQSDYIAGVAVAAALIPPLSAAGIGLALRDMNAVRGAILLFGANLFAIILMSIIILTLAGLAKLKTEEERLSITLGLVISATMITIIAIPLGLVVKESITINNQESLIYKTLTSEIRIIHPDTNIASLSISGLERTAQETHIETTITAPFGSTLYVTDQEHIAKKLSQLIKKKVTLDINITPIFKAEAFTEPEAETDQLALILPSVLGKHISEAELLTYELDSETDPPTLHMEIQVPSHIEITEQTKNELQQSIASLYGQEIQAKLRIFRYETPLEALSEDELQLNSQ